MRRGSHLLLLLFFIGSVKKKQDRITVKDACPTTFSVPKINKKMVV